MRTVALLAFLAVAQTADVSAQQIAAKIPTGIWTGSVTPPGAEEAAVKFDVTSQNDSVAITIDAGGHGTFKAEGVKVEPTRIVFSFRPGPLVVCVLTKKDDETFAGECTDDGGAAALIVMVPPKKES